MLTFSAVATTWSPATTPLPTLAATNRPHTILLLLLPTTPSPPTRPLMLLRLTLLPNSTTTHPPQRPTLLATLQSGNDYFNLIHVSFYWIKWMYLQLCYWALLHYDLCYSDSLPGQPTVQRCHLHQMSNRIVDFNVKLYSKIRLFLWLKSLNPSLLFSPIQMYLLNSCILIIFL